jgi:hypothetical protein
MKILLTNDENNIAIACDLTGLENNKGLLGQTIVELELNKGRKKK